MYPESNFRLSKIETNVPISATRGSPNTDYTGHDRSSFSHSFCANNPFLAGFLLIAFLSSISSPSWQMSRGFHQTCPDTEIICAFLITRGGGRVIKSRRQMTQPTRLKITQGKMREIRRKGSQKTIGMSAWNTLNIIYPSKANSVLAVWDGFWTPPGRTNKKKGEKKYDNISYEVSDHIWIEFKVGQWSRAERNNL